jgi:hypothetical protein
MRNILLFVLLVVAGAYAGATTRISTNITQEFRGLGSPTNVRIYAVSDATLDSLSDTMGVGDRVLFGPIPFGANEGKTASGVQVVVPASCFASADTNVITFIPTLSIAAGDSLGTASTQDTAFATTAKTTTYRSLTTTIGTHFYVGIRAVNASNITKKIRVIVLDQ